MADYANAADNKIQSEPTRMGFEPTRAEHIGLAVQFQFQLTTRPPRLK